MIDRDEEILDRLERILDELEDIVSAAREEDGVDYARNLRIRVRKAGGHSSCR
jgi:hypothetical protein